MTVSEHGSPGWNALWLMHEAAIIEVADAWAVVQDRYAAGQDPTREEMARLEQARASRGAVEKKLDEFMTTRPARSQP